MLQAAVGKTGCLHLAVLLGDQGTKLENVGELRFLLLNAATVRQAFDHLVRFVTLMHQPIRMRITTEREYTGLSLALTEKTPGAELILVGYTAAAVKALRTIIGVQWNPSIVHLAVRRPKNIDPYRRFFGTTVLFDQPDYRVLFATSILDTPRTAGDPQLAEFIFERLCLLEREAPRDLVGQVRHAIETRCCRVIATSSASPGCFRVTARPCTATCRDSAQRSRPCWTIRVGHWPFACSNTPTFPSQKLRRRCATATRRP